MLKINSKAFNLSLLCALLFCFFITLADFNASCEELKNNVLRLHILANSDSSCDQELKIKVRDAILSQSEELFKETNDINGAILRAEASIDEITEIAKNVLKDEGYNYKVEAKVDTAYFATRHYEDFTLPAGYYNSLIVSLGDAEGKNWWCILFPELCVPSSTPKAELSDAVSTKSESICKNSERYIARFKIVEIYEKIKKLINY